MYIYMHTYTYREKDRIEAETQRRMVELEKEIARVEQFKSDKEKAEARWREQVEALSQGTHVYLCMRVGMYV